mmetsp:Transcript_63068/g.150472  ORF Transcript_63068/g.150472 Transcript_63068/m.150472 type:complete len:222 (-) Transcript_63068:1248-1913(-)
MTPENGLRQIGHVRCPGPDSHRADAHGTHSPPCPHCSSKASRGRSRQTMQQSSSSSWSAAVEPFAAATFAAASLEPLAAFEPLAATGPSASNLSSTVRSVAPWGVERSSMTMAPWTTLFAALFVALPAPAPDPAPVEPAPPDVLRGLGVIGAASPAPSGCAEGGQFGASSRQYKVPATRRILVGASSEVVSSTATGRRSANPRPGTNTAARPPFPAAAPPR